MWWFFNKVETTEDTEYQYDVYRDKHFKSEVLRASQHDMTYTRVFDEILYKLERIEKLLGSVERVEKILDELEKEENGK